MCVCVCVFFYCFFQYPRKKLTIKPPSTSHLWTCDWKIPGSVIPSALSTGREEEEEAWRLGGTINWGTGIGTGRGDFGKAFIFIWLGTNEGSRRMKDPQLRSLLMVKKLFRKSREQRAESEGTGRLSDRWGSRLYAKQLGLEETGGFFLALPTSTVVVAYCLVRKRRALKTWRGDSSVCC